MQLILINMPLKIMKTLIENAVNRFYSNKEHTPIIKAK